MKSLLAIEGKNLAMRRIDVKDRLQIKQLLYCDCVLGVKDSQYQSFDGFQLWWYDKQHGVCRTCKAQWSITRQFLERCSLDKAAEVLWRKRRSLFIRARRVSQDRQLTTMNRFWG